METRRSNLTYNIIKEVNTKNGPHMVGKTTAMLEDCELDAFRIVDKITCNCTNPVFGIVGMDRIRMLDEYYMAKSKLNVAAGDTFNEEEGKRIARERVLDKYHGDLNAALCAYLQDAREIVARLENYMLKHDIDYSSALTEAEIKRTKLSGAAPGSNKCDEEVIL